MFNYLLWLQTKAYNLGRISCNNRIRRHICSYYRTSTYSSTSPYSHTAKKCYICAKPYVLLYYDIFLYILRMIRCTYIKPLTYLASMITGHDSKTYSCA